MIFFSSVSPSWCFIIVCTTTSDSVQTLRVIQNLQSTAVTSSQSARCVKWHDGTLKTQQTGNFLQKPWNAVWEIDILLFLMRRCFASYFYVIKTSPCCLLPTLVHFVRKGFWENSHKEEEKGGFKPILNLHNGCKAPVRFYFYQGKLGDSKWGSLILLSGTTNEPGKPFPRGLISTCWLEFK